MIAPLAERPKTRRPTGRRRFAIAIVSLGTIALWWAFTRQNDSRFVGEWAIDGSSRFIFRQDGTGFVDSFPIGWSVYGDKLYVNFEYDRPLRRKIEALTSHIRGEGLGIESVYDVLEVQSDKLKLRQHDVLGDGMTTLTRIATFPTLHSNRAQSSPAASSSRAAESAD